MKKSIYTARQKRLLNLLRQVRNEAKLSQVEVAQRLEKPQSFVSRYETGERRLDILELQEVCEVLGISLSEFARRLERVLKAK